MQSDVLVAETHPEWTMACDVQQHFMRRPIATLEALDYSALCRQMHALGGDCYDFMPLGNDRAAFAVGDASGKGLSAALLIANVQSSLRTAAGFAGDDTAAVLAAVNQQVHASSAPDRYATLFYGVFDARTRALRYVNAGHIPPIVLRRDGSVQWLEQGGAPVGMFANWAYEEGTVRLHPGDWVVAYTDGIIEAVNPSGEEWGLDGLRCAAAGTGAPTADAMVHAIFAAMDEFSCGRQTDDATVAVLGAQ
jgi:phosphoserine phosphatase RsbU/P